MDEKQLIISPGELVATAAYHLMTSANPGGFNVTLLMQIIAVAFEALKAIMDLINQKLAQPHLS
jgi:hypothetical protein